MLVYASDSLSFRAFLISVRLQLDNFLLSFLIDNARCLFPRVKNIFVVIQYLLTHLVTKTLVLYLILDVHLNMHLNYLMNIVFIVFNRRLDNV